MHDPFADGTPAGDDHTWIRPASPPCPDCECCTAALCARGREHVLGCGAACRPEDWETVRHCPCSAESTPGTAGHHLRAAIARRDSPEARRPHPYERIPYAETAGLCWCGRVEEHRLHIPLDGPGDDEETSDDR